MVGLVNKLTVLTLEESLGEHRIRQLNDHINKLIREKGHWERRIKELGGPDYQVCNLSKGVNHLSEDVKLGSA